MKRKIVQQGPSTLMVSLPSKWARQQGLKKGEDIEVEESDTSLIIHSEKKPDLTQKASINLADYGILSKRAIGALYKRGFDEIEILFSSPKDIDIVNQALQELIGVEIVSQTEKGCVIKEISLSNKEEFDLIFNRTVLLLKSVADDCLNALKARDLAMLGSLPDRDVTINKYANYCRRILNEHGYKDSAKLPMLYYLVEEIERLGDEYKSLVLLVIDNRIALDASQLQLLQSVNRQLDMLYHLLLKYDSKKAVELYSECKSFQSKLHRLDKTDSVKKARLIGCFANISQMMSNMLGPIMTMELK